MNKKKRIYKDTLTAEENLKKGDKYNAINTIK